MKKFYSLLAMMMMAGATFAQTISVTVDGNAVSNGQTVECQYDKIEYPGPIPVIPTTWKMEPHVSITSTVAQDVTVAIDVQEKKGEDQIQNCFTNCITANSANNYIVSETQGLPANKPKDAGIHFSTKVNPNENPLHRNVLVTVSAGAESISFTLHMFWDPNANAVECVEAENADAQAYSLTGMPVNVEALPAGAIYVKGGNKYIK